MAAAMLFKKTVSSVTKGSNILITPSGTIGK